MKDFEGENENINQGEKGIYKISCYYTWSVGDVIHVKHYYDYKAKRFIDKNIIILLLTE